MSIKTKSHFQTSALYSIIITAIVLFLIGLFGIIFIHGKKLTDYFKENIEFTIILKDGTPDTNALAYQKQLQSFPFITSAVYVSKDDAAKIFMQDTGEDFTKVLNDNPLFASINIHLLPQYANTDSIAKVKSIVTQNGMVSDFYYMQSLVDAINDNVRKAGFIIIAISVLLLIVAITLVDSTIRLSMYSNRFLIKSMQLVGATHWVITKPFIYRGVINGFISSLLAVLGLFSILDIAISRVPELRALQDYTFTLSLMLLIILLGLVFSFVSTYFAVNKYLKKRLDDLY
jgi:cell division transport system permease protein